jgi:hypothetical protein
MAKFSEQTRNRRRARRRFRPGLDLGSEGATVLDRRLLLSLALTMGVNPGHPAARVMRLAGHVHHNGKVHHPPRRPTLAQEINSQFAAFLAAFRVVEESYVASINEQSTGMITVSANVTAPYAAGSPVIPVRPDRQRRQSAYHQSSAVELHPVESRDGPLGDRPRLRCHQRHVDLPDLHHGQHHPTGRGSGPILQQHTGPIAQGDHAASFTPAAGRDPKVRLPAGGR